jgi:hypothetical protein
VLAEGGRVEAPAADTSVELLAAALGVLIERLCDDEDEADDEAEVGCATVSSELFPAFKLP